jgi:hypothetical protein
MTHGATSTDWTKERRAKQSVAIQKWRPWEKSAGPKSRMGKRRSAMRALKSGKTSKSVITARKTAAAFRRLETKLASKISAG